MPRGSSLAKIKEWTSRLQRFEASNGTVSAFCGSDGVSEPSFYYWKKKLRCEAMVQPFEAIRVAPRLASFDTAPTKEETVIQLGGGICIQLGSDLSVVELVVKQLLATSIDARSSGTPSAGVESC